MKTTNGSSSVKERNVGNFSSTLLLETLLPDSTVKTDAGSSDNIAAWRPRYEACTTRPRLRLTYRLANRAYTHPVSRVLSRHRECSELMNSREQTLTASPRSVCTQVPYSSGEPVGLGGERERELYAPTVCCRHFARDVSLFIRAAVLHRQRPFIRHAVAVLSPFSLPPLRFLRPTERHSNSRLGLTTARQP